MVAINNYSVSLSLEAGNYIKNSQLSRSETTRLRREVEKARTPVESYKLAVNRLGRAWEAGAIDHKVYTRLLREAESKYKSATAAAAALEAKQRELNYQLYIQQTRHLRGVSASTETYTQKLNTLALRIGAVALAYSAMRKASDFVLDGIRLAAQAEQAQVAFEVMLKSAKSAAVVLSDLRGFAASTPFSQDQILQSGRSMLAVGLAADSLTDRMRMLGDLSAGSGIRIEELSRIYSKFYSSNIIQAEELNQLVDRGIAIYDELAEVVGVDTAAAVRKLASEGRITFSQLDEALKNLVKNDFAGLTEKLSHSMIGTWSTFNDELERTKRILGEAIAGGRGSFLGQITEVLDKANDAFKFVTDPAGKAQEDVLAVSGAISKAGKSGFSSMLGPLFKTSGKFSPSEANKIFGTLGSVASNNASNQLGGAGIAATALGAGLQNLGMQIAGSFKFHTEKLAKALDTSLVPAFEMGSAETAQAILKAQNDQINMERKDDNEKKEREKKSLIAVEKTASLLEEQLLLWKGGEGISKKIR